MTRRLLITVLLAAIWIAITGKLDGPNVLLGGTLGFLVTLLLRGLIHLDDHERHGAESHERQAGGEDTERQEGGEDVLPKRRRSGLHAAGRQVWAFVELLFVFIWDLLLSSLRVAVDVVTPRHNMESAVIAYPLDVRSDLEITVLANLISLTPGTLTLDHDAEHRRLFIHVMHISNQDVASERKKIKRLMERRVQRVFGAD